MWNHLQIPNSTTTNPTFANLVDSTGASTTVTFAISGRVYSFNIFGLVSGADALRGDAFNFNEFDASANLDWTLTGLTPSTNYLLFVYGGFWNTNYRFNMLVDTDADGDLSDETSQVVNTFNRAQPPGVLFSALSNASGVIRGRGVGNTPFGGSNEAVWTGFQVVEGILASVCGNSVVEGTEQCDLGSALNGQPSVCCTSTCTFKPVNTTCRESAGVCDVAEVCSGSSASCPANGFASAGTSCGGSAAACDALDTCNGSGGCVDNIDPAGTICRPAVDACDVTESCTGASASCPVDVGVPATLGGVVNGLNNQPCQGGPGSDTVAGTDGPDVIRGGSGADTLRGRDGDDLLCGEAGADTLSGGEHNDTLVGGSENDSFTGDRGDDLLVGGLGDDDLSGGEGDDTLLGEGGNDTLLGARGDDTLDGGSEDDVLHGGKGQDTLAGGVGSDLLNGGDEVDDCTDADQAGPFPSCE